MCARIMLLAHHPLFVQGRNKGAVWKVDGGFTWDFLGLLEGFFKFLVMLLGTLEGFWREFGGSLERVL